MTELTHNPLWRPDDLGSPIPNSPHAVSACLPTWADNIGYEEQEPRVVERLTTGYPRFVYNQFCRELFAECERRFANGNEQSLAFPSEAAAKRFARFMQTEADYDAQIHRLGMHDVHAVCFPEELEKVAKSGWQHCGEGVSSRLAEACLTGRQVSSAESALAEIRERLSASMGVKPENVFLFSCGMSAFYALHRTVQEFLPQRRSVQFGFPYVDSLKVQQKCGPGVEFYPQGNSDELAELAQLLDGEQISALFTEFPSNPLLASPNLSGLAALARKHAFPLVVDDTIATSVNVRLWDVADVVWTSLTKFFSGAGDVTAGAVVVNPESQFASEFLESLQASGVGTLWCEDAIVLEQNSRDFETRVGKINNTAEQLADFLDQHTRVDRVYYPKFETPEMYNAFRRAEGGYSGLFSILLHDAEATTPRFFDTLRVNKGPNLGTNYTLACPFTILAHYNELEFAESCGVSRYLVRVSVGLEEADELIARFADALDAIE